MFSVDCNKKGIQTEQYKMNLLVSLRMDGPTLTLSVLGPVELQQDGRVKAKPRPVLRQECVTRSLLEPSRDHHLGKGQCESGTLLDLRSKRC